MTIDAIFLARIPSAHLRLLVRMARTLIRDAPDKQNGPVKAALAKLIAHIALINAALSHRVRLSNPQVVARELDFDRALDTLWVALRVCLDQTAHAFGHEGLDGLSEARKDKLDLEELRSLAGLASSTHAQLFGNEGTKFVKSSFPDQAEAMATLLRIIEEDDLRSSIDQVVNDRFVDAVVVCQAEYEEIVDARLRRELGVTDDFRALRTRLRFLLGRYKSAVEGLYAEDKPETAAVVTEALRALMVVNAHLSRGSTTPADNEALDAVLEPDELLDLDDSDEVVNDDEPEPADEPTTEAEA